MGVAKLLSTQSKQGQLSSKNHVHLNFGICIYPYKHRLFNISVLIFSVDSIFEARFNIGVAVLEISGVIKSP